MSEHVYKTSGTCSRKITFELDDEKKVHNVAFEGGCHGNLQGVSRLVEGMDAEEIIRAVLSDFEVEVLEKRPVEYRCYCSRDRVTRALISMGKGELSALIEEQGEAELTCQFCDAIYHYSKEELEALLAQM